MEPCPRRGGSAASRSSVDQVRLRVDHAGLTIKAPTAPPSSRSRERARPAPLALRRRRQAGGEVGGRSTSRSGTVTSHGKHTPWGEEDSPALTTAVESDLERELSASIMREGKKLERRNLEQGQALMTEGEGWRGALPAARRRCRRRGQRRLGRRDRPRCPARRARAARGRQAHGNGLGNDADSGGRRAAGRDRRVGAPGTRRLASPGSLKVT